MAAKTHLGLPKYSSERAPLLALRMSGVCGLLVGAEKRSDTAGCAAFFVEEGAAALSAACAAAAGPTASSECALIDVCMAWRRTAAGLSKFGVSGGGCVCDRVGERRGAQKYAHAVRGRPFPLTI